MKKSILKFLPFAFMPILNTSTLTTSNKDVIPNKKRVNELGWGYSKPSEYFGQRSKIVTAQTPKGEKLMKLKNALKGNYEWSFL